MHLDLPKGGSKQITQNPNKDPSVLVVFPMEKNKHITLKNPLSVYTIYIYIHTHIHILTFVLHMITKMRVS